MKWPLARLGDIAPICRRPVEIDINASYPELGIRSFGRGTFHKPPLAGIDVGAKKLYEIHPGDLVFSNVFAWEGAVAVATADDAGRFGSHRFIACAVDPNRADAQFICSYLTASPEGLEQLQRASPGGAGRNRTLGLEKLADIRVPAPPLAEQRAIVARLDALADKTLQLATHLDAIEAETNALILALHFQLAAGNEAPLSEFLELHEESIPTKLGEEYPQVGVRSFGGGLFAKSAISASDTTYRSFNRLYADAIVLSQVKGWEGAIALTPPSLSGMFVSPEYRTFRCRSEKAVPGYLGELFKTSWFWSLLQDATRGVGARRERTRPEKFLNVLLPMPSIEKQIEACEMFVRLRAVNARYAAIRADNAALLPSALDRIFAQ